MESRPLLIVCSTSSDPDSTTKLPVLPHMVKELTRMFRGDPENETDAFRFGISSWLSASECHSMPSMLSNVKSMSTVGKLSGGMLWFALVVCLLWISSENSFVCLPHKKVGLKKVAK